MRGNLALAVLVLAVALVTLSLRTPPPVSGQGVIGATIYFWPALATDRAPEHLEAIVEREIRGAHQEVLVQAYSFTDSVIADALLFARDTNGAQISVIVDKSQETENDTQALFLKNRKVPILSDHRAEEAHSKVVIIDGREVLTGSPNLSKAGLTENAENLVILSGPDNAARYRLNFLQRWNASRDYFYTGKEPIKRQ